MASLISELEASDMRVPDYKNSNLSVVNRLAADYSRGRAHKTVFMALDALGFSLFSAVLKARPQLSKVLSNAVIEKVSTVFPTFTLTVFPSLDSGLTPAEHGIVGPYTPVKELGRNVDVLGRIQDFEKGYIFPAPKNIEIFNKENRMLYVTPKEISASSYSKVAFGGGSIRPYVSVIDMFVQVTKAIKSGKYDFVYSYSDIMDATQHKYFPYAHETIETLYSVFMLLDRLLMPNLRRHGWSLIITADHGHIVNDKLRVIKPGSASMRFLSAAPWGSGRAVIFSVISGFEKAFENAFNKEFGGDIMLISSSEAIKAGIFGSKHVTNGFEYRFGDYIALPKRNTFLLYAKPGKEYNRKNFIGGHHGGMSPDEVEVPLIKL